MVEVAVVSVTERPMLIGIVIWSVAAIASSIASWRSFAIFFGITAAVIGAGALFVDSLPDAGGEWPRDEAFLWLFGSGFAVVGFLVCAVIAGVAQSLRERAQVQEEFE